MSTPSDRAKSAIGGLAAGQSSNIPGLNSGANTMSTADQTAQAQTFQQAPMAVQVAAHQALLQLIDTRVSAVIAAAKGEEAKIVTFAKKYWPIAAGLGIAATRLIH